MLAFLGLLWSIRLQEHELREASKQLRDDRLREELLHIIKDIDSRLTLLLGVEVSPQSSTMPISFSHMIAEAERLKNTHGDSTAYSAFLQQAKASGSVIEASVREINYLVAKMREFLEQYSSFTSSNHAPVFEYYGGRICRLLPMLEDIGCISSETLAFLAPIRDKNRS